MADFKELTDAQKKAIYKEQLAQRYVFELNMDPNSKYALEGTQRSDFRGKEDYYNDIEENIGILKNLGVDAQQGKNILQENKPVRVFKEGHIVVEKSALADFVKKTDAKFAGRDVVLPELAADKTKINDQGLVESFKKQQPSASR